MSGSALQRLVDAEEIRQLKNRYMYLVDRCPEEREAAAEQIAQLFVEDCELDFSQTSTLGRTLAGRDEVRQMYGVTNPGIWSWSWHVAYSPVIELDGDRATATWMLYALSERHAEPGTTFLTYGRYHDEYRRTAQGWRQSRLTFLNETRPHSSAIGAPPSAPPSAPPGAP